MKQAFVFPGQGSQQVGMGKAIAQAFSCAREVFEQVDDVLHQKLSALIFEGPEEELRLTENTQPALMAVSMAVLRVLQKEGGLDLAKAASFVAGHSLGEYAALCAAEALTLADTARLLRQRGKAMQQAVPVGIGAMAALLGADIDAAREIAALAAQDEVCVAANDNAPGQVVISGHVDAVDRAIALAAERGYKRSVKLPVSAPFHSPLMEPAAKVMQESLAGVDLKAPIVPIVNNVTAVSTREPETIRKLLVQQVTGAVRWRESVLYMKVQGVTGLVECGAGTVLTGLTKRIDRALPCLAVHTPQEIEAYLLKK